MLTIFVENKKVQKITKINFLHLSLLIICKLHQMTKPKLFIILLVFLGINTQAQINLIGVKANQGTGSIDVVKWQALNPASVSSYPSLLEAYYMGSSGFDAYNSTYYISGIGAQASGLFAFNTLTNTQSLADYTAFSNISEIDMSTGKIYTLETNAAGYIKVNEYDISTGTDNLLGTIYEPGIMGLIADAIGFDSNNGILYYVGVDGTSSLCLYGIPVREEVFSYSKTPVITSTPGNISSVNYDNVNNTLFALNNEYNASGIYTGSKVVEINKITGDVITRGELTGFDAFLAGSSSFDQNSGSLLLVGFNENLAGSMIIFNTLDNTYQTGFVPGNVSEIVCDNYSFAKNAYTTTSVNESRKSVVKIYPNPASTKITITNNAELFKEINVTIFNIDGKKILTDNFRNIETVELDISRFMPGIYMVKTETPEGIETTKVSIR